MRRTITLCSMIGALLTSSVVSADTITDSTYLGGGNLGNYSQSVRWEHIVNPPATATRWPTWSEIVNPPATATRWPTWSEIRDEYGRLPLDMISAPEGFPSKEHDHDERYLRIAGGTAVGNITVKGADFHVVGDAKVDGFFRVQKDGLTGPEDGIVEMGVGLRRQQPDRATIALMSPGDLPTDILLGNGTAGNVDDRAKWSITSRGEEDNHALSFYAAPRLTDEGASWRRVITFEPNASVGIGTGSADPDATVWIRQRDKLAALKISSSINQGPDIYLSGGGLIAVDGSFSINVPNTVNFRDGGFTADSPRFFYVTRNGNVYANDYRSLSDRRLKFDIVPLQDSLDKITRLQGVSYKWESNPEEGIQLGLIAQEVQEVFPELIDTDEETGNLSVRYVALIAPMIESIKELKKENERLMQELAEIKEVLLKSLQE